MKNYENTATAIRKVIESIPSMYISELEYDDDGRIISYTNASTNVTYEYSYVTISGVDYISKISTNIGTYAYIYNSEADIVAHKSPWTMTVGKPMPINIFLLENSPTIGESDIIEIERFPMPEDMALSYGALFANDIRLFTGGKYEDGRHLMALDYDGMNYYLVIYKSKDAIISNDCSDLIA